MREPGAKLNVEKGKPRGRTINREVELDAWSGGFEKVKIKIKDLIYLIKRKE
jgi:hypothetical protein